MSGDEQTVYAFMVAANRPFSGNDVFSGLQRQGIGKPAVDKALDRLARDNRIVVKLNGKQKIYCAAQPAAVDGTAEVDEQLVRVNEALRRAEREYKQSEVDVRAVRGTLSTAEAERKVAELEMVVAELGQRLNELSRQTASAMAGGDVPGRDDVERARKDCERATKEYRKRKRMCADMLDAILENCPLTKAALYEEIGIETDESAGMPSLCEPAPQFPKTRRT